LGETRVDLLHLLADLRDAYPGPLEETIFTELVANSLDSGARSIRLQVDAAAATLVTVDDGRGMTRRELGRYHDLGATTKRRGRGIGFAGVGVKLGLLACDEVITETRRGRTHAATCWRLASRTRAPWQWIEAPGRLDREGTAVALRLTSALSPLLDPGLLEATLLRHFQPLFEPEFVEILAPAYPAGVSIRINEQLVVGPIRSAERVLLGVRVGRQRKASGVGYLARHAEALPETERGIAISTLGKVIRRGWDWLGLTPLDGARIEGVIEVPDLAEALTLNKGDFLRHGARGALYLAYRKAIQEAVAAQLDAWGEAGAPRERRPRTRPIERDLQRVLLELAEDFPLLTTLVERRSGGQRRLPFGDPREPGVGAWAGADLLAAEPPGAYASAGDAEPAAGPARQPRDGDREPDGERPPPEAPAETARRAGNVRLPTRGRRKRPSRLSLAIRFESRPEDPSLGRLIESTVWVNDAHPAYRRAAASRSEAYHIALTAAMALAPLTVEASEMHDFVSAFLGRWGEAALGNGRKRSG
jgi:hypothetical protein